MGIRFPKVPLVVALMRAATQVAGSAEVEGGKFDWKRGSGCVRCRSAHMSLRAYEVQFFKTASQIPNGLWEACFQPPAEGRWWNETLDQSGIDDQFTLLYGLVKHLGRPVGIAPVFVMDLPVEQFAPREFFAVIAARWKDRAVCLMPAGPYLSALQSSKKA